MVRGTWRAPGLSAVTLADYAASLLLVRVDLDPKSQQLYGSCAGSGSTPRTSCRRGVGGAVQRAGAIGDARDAAAALEPVKARPLSLPCRQPVSAAGSPVTRVL